LSGGHLILASLSPAGRPNTFRPGSFGVSPSKLLKSTEASFRVKNPKIPVSN